MRISQAATPSSPSPAGATPNRRAFPPLARPAGHLARAGRTAWIGAASGTGLLAQTGAALAHASERGHVLLLPTGHYLAGGALAVALSFAVLAFVPAARLERPAAWRLSLFAVPLRWRMATSLLSCALLVLLVSAGFWGSRDPLGNPLPLTVWTIFWIGLPILQATLGNLWFWLDPWFGPVRLVERLGLWPRRRMPAGIGMAPALPLLFLFILFELIDPAPDDPARLAAATAAYWAVTFAAMLLTGHEAWSRRGEFFSVFFRLLARLAVTEGREAGNGRCRLHLCLPAAKLWTAPPLPPSGALFLLLALSGIAFDGFSKTFLYLGAVGVNPLEYPGRSALVAVNTAGLALAFAVLAGLFFLAVRLGLALARRRSGFLEAAGLTAWSLLPIAFAYQFAHYLTALLVNGQYWLVALSDPWWRGWNFFGTATLPVRAGIAAGSSGAWAVWNIQALAIVGGHLLAVLAAHGLARRLFPEAREAALFLLPLTLLMIAYTVFGLWLLSTPTGV